VNQKKTQPLKIVVGKIFVSLMFVDTEVNKKLCYCRGTAWRACQYKSCN